MYIGENLYKMTKDNSGGLIPRGFGEKSRLLIRGLGEYFLKQILPSKFKPKTIKKDYLFNIYSPIFIESKLDEKIIVPIEINNFFEYNSYTPIEKNKSFSYILFSSIFVNSEYNYNLQNKINNKKLVNYMMNILEDE